jgi:hypothetical protein
VVFDLRLNPSPSPSADDFTAKVVLCLTGRKEEDFEACSHALCQKISGDLW